MDDSVPEGFSRYEVRHDDECLGEPVQAAKAVGSLQAFGRVRMANPADTEIWKKPGIEEAGDQAIDDIPEDFEIRAFLNGHRAEVKDICITEYNEAETMELFKKEGSGMRLPQKITLNGKVVNQRSKCNFL